MMTEDMERCSELGNVLGEKIIESGREPSLTETECMALTLVQGFLQGMGRGNRLIVMVNWYGGILSCPHNVRRHEDLDEALQMRDAARHMIMQQIDGTFLTVDLP